MKIIALDDERLVLENLAETIKNINSSYELNCFTDWEQALEFIRCNGADVALLDVEMPEKSGLELAKLIKQICPKINIIFVTGHSQYSLQALKMHASGYVLKPVRVKDLTDEINYLRYEPENLNGGGRYRLKIQTFGHFDVFCDGLPIAFSRSKCKEILAYLVDRRGASVTLSELAGIIWEDGRYDISRQRQLHVFIGALKQTLAKVSFEDVLIHRSRTLSLNVEKVDCDYYNFLNGDVSAINSYFGEYMSQYGWAEFTVAQLDGRTNFPIG